MQVSNLPGYREMSPYYVVRQMVSSDADVTLRPSYPPLIVRTPWR